jgi:hypothetical protein
MSYDKRFGLGTLLALDADPMATACQVRMSFWQAPFLPRLLNQRRLKSTIVSSFVSS